MTQELAVSARGITKVFGEGNVAFKALQGIDIEVPTGEFMMLAGPSGSGKTTLLSIIGCVLGKTGGSLSLFGEDVDRIKPSQLPGVRLDSIGFIFQGHNLIASLPVLENVALTPRMQGASVKESHMRAKQLLERVGLADKAGNLPSALSGGQRQRVAIARALAGDPPLILADEPTAALDAKSGLLVTELLKELNRERKVTVIVVTHDNRIFHLADRIIHLADGQIVDGEQEAAR